MTYHLGCCEYPKQQQKPGRSRDPDFEWGKKTLMTGDGTKCYEPRRTRSVGIMMKALSLSSVSRLGLREETCQHRSRRVWQLHVLPHTDWSVLFEEAATYIQLAKPGLLCSQDLAGPASARTLPTLNASCGRLAELPDSRFGGQKAKVESKLRTKNGEKCWTCAPVGEGRAMGMDSGPGPRGSVTSKGQGV